MFNIPMKYNDPIRTTQMSKNTFRVYMPKRTNELTTSALSRMPDQSQSGYSSHFSGNSTHSGNAQNQKCPPQNNYYSQQGNAQNQQRPLQNNYTQQGNAQNQTKCNNNSITYNQQSSPAQQPVKKRSPLPPPIRLLKKGEKYSITKNNPATDKLCIGVGWDFSGSLSYDVDVEAFMLNDSEKVPDDSWIVFYGQLKSPDCSVIHKGDSTNTNLGADCEQITVDLGMMSTEITKIAFVVTINEAKLHGYNFSGIKNAYIRISDVKTGKEIIRYELTDYYREVVSMVVGELYFRNGEWRFNPVGMGTDDDLEGLCNKYGIEVQ